MLLPTTHGFSHGLLVTCGDMKFLLKQCMHRHFQGSCAENEK